MEVKTDPQHGKDTGDIGLLARTVSEGKLQSTGLPVFLTTQIYILPSHPQTLSVEASKIALSLRNNIHLSNLSDLCERSRKYYP